MDISADLLAQILAAAPRTDSSKPAFIVAVFSGANFEGEAEFDWATFSGEARFDGAIFSGGTRFYEAIFSGGVRFDGAMFSGDADFGEATFSGGVRFDRAMFSGDASFGEATFSGNTLFDGVTFSGFVTFQGTNFSDDVRLSGANFSENAWFSGATFSGYILFDGATFSGNPMFDGVTFSDDASFGEATFSGNPMFNGATFSGRAIFNGATFSGRAMFGGADFLNDAWFAGAGFSGDATFEKASFSSEARFDSAIFSGDAGFTGVLFRGPVVFTGARFNEASQLGPILACRGLILDDAEFSHAVQIEASTTGMCCRRTRFPGGVQFRLRWAQVVLDDADFPAPSILTGIPRLADAELAKHEERIGRAWQRLLADDISDRPQVLSVRRANVAGLGFSNVTMANCLFAGAHDLDEMRLEADVSFPLARSPLGRLSWEGRQVIAEECAWRAARSHPRGWAAPSLPTWVDEPPVILDPGQIADLYRALRKGREDIKDEPGAADFYYGEMEMRRRARLTGSHTSRGRAERVVLKTYWLVSGYGLRAWRALTWLTAISALFAVAFHLVGFARPPQPVSYWTSLLYAFRATISLTDDNVQLTAWGQSLQGLLRLTGPVLLGLALLALRGRVKR